MLAHYHIGANFQIKKNDMIHSVGTHVMLELWQVNHYNSTIEIENIIKKAITDSGCTLLNMYTRLFDDSSITCLAALEESHICLHTCPDMDYMAVDIFTCDKTADSSKAVDCIISRFKPRHYQMMSIKRGTKL